MLIWGLYTLLDRLPESKFSTVVIDPPWDSGGYLDGARGNYYRRGKGAAERPAVHREFDFPTMTDDQIQAMPVPDLLECDSFVFLWTVMNRLPIAFDILKHWRLKYMFLITWVKPNGPRPVGYPAYNSEFCAVGKKGRPKFLTTKGFYTANRWDQARIFGEAAQGAWGRQVRACEKPELFYELLRVVTPGPRLDMFSRREIEGFTVWGNEVV